MCLEDAAWESHEPLAAHKFAEVFSAQAVDVNPAFPVPTPSSPKRLFHKLPLRQCAQTLHAFASTSPQCQ